MKEKLMNFLLIEDDDDHALIITRNLEENRISNGVVRLADGEQALNYLFRRSPFENANRPDIILLDLKLPKVDGLEVLRQIKEDAQLSLIPVVVLTTSDAESDRTRAYGFHVNSYLVKPVDFEKFKRMVVDLSLYWGVWNKPAPTQG